MKVLIRAGVGALACAIFLTGIGSYPLRDYDEASYAVLIDETREEGGFLDFRFTDKPWYEKPPLYFWSVMTLRDMGVSAETAIRLPSALASVVIVMLVFEIALTVSGSVAGALISSLVILTTGSFVDIGRQGLLDTAVALAILASFYCLVRSRDDKRYLYGIGVLIGLGVMVKSVVALLALLPIGMYIVIARKLNMLKDRRLWIGVCIGMTLILPWHIYMGVTAGGEFFREYFGEHVVGRFSGNLFAWQLSPIQYLESFFRMSLPWGIALVVAFPLILYRRMFRDREYLTFASLALSSVIIVALFTTSATRVYTYFLPAYPFIAIALGIAFSVMYRRFGSLAYGPTVVLSVIAIVNTALIGYGYDADGKYRRELVAEEKAIGEMLRGAEETVYFLKPDDHETVRYYSGNRRILEWKDEYLGKCTCLMVAPQGEPKGLRTAGSLYEGRLLRLIRIGL